MEKKIQSKGNTEMCAFSRIRDNPKCSSETHTIQNREQQGSSSEQERKVNALALGADEGRD